MGNIFGTPELFLVVNTYSGESRWLPLNEATELIQKDEYWEIDSSQKPIHEVPL